MTTTSPKIRLGVSSCLLGESVRFDGGHKKDAYLTNTLAPFVEWVAVCPEVEIGLGTPREPIRLVGSGGASTPRLITLRTNVDHTSRMKSYAQAKVEQLKHYDLNGYILKKDSPSCGLERVKVYHENGTPTKTGVGIFAAVLMKKLPHLPVEDEGRLHDPRVRANFIVRVFSHHRWQELSKQSFRLRDLIDFHARHKLLLMAHSEAHLRALGKLVAAAKKHRPRELLEKYAHLFFAALRNHATRRKHTNVLMHIAGYFKNELGAGDRRELHTLIGNYRKGLVPLIVPVTLIKHHLHQYEVPYLRDQIYLNPHPKELMLLNHV
jgi:uncharacterized protein YbgA (DUF1722 family)/uncharacterized protein YbbK (DUF523 family)